MKTKHYHWFPENATPGTFWIAKLTHYNVIFWLYDGHWIRGPFRTPKTKLKPKTAEKSSLGLKRQTQPPETGRESEKKGKRC